MENRIKERNKCTYYLHRKEKKNKTKTSRTEIDSELDAMCKAAKHTCNIYLLIYILFI